MNSETNETTTVGCPSLGLPTIPSGADGVEPAVPTDYEDIITDVFHICNEAFINAPYQRDARPMYFKTILGDIAEALESVVPCDRARGTRAPTDVCLSAWPGDEMDEVIKNLTPEMLKRICERHGLKKRMTRDEYMTVAPGVKLHEFKGTNATRLLAVRDGKQGNADLLYEIVVDHNNSTAVIETDGSVMYQIRTLGLSHRRVIHAAIQVLRSHLAENDGVHRRHRLSRQRRAGILTPDQEVAATVARQNDDDDIAERIENA